LVSDFLQDLRMNMNGVKYIYFLTAL
jgi:hypothetical protein